MVKSFGFLPKFQDRCLSKSICMRAPEMHKPETTVSVNSNVFFYIPFVRVVSISSYLGLTHFLSFMAHLFPGQLRSFVNDAIIKSWSSWRKVTSHTGIPLWFESWGTFLYTLWSGSFLNLLVVGLFVWLLFLLVICTFFVERFFLLEKKKKAYWP